MNGLRRACVVAIAFCAGISACQLVFPFHAGDDTSDASTNDGAADTIVETSSETATDAPKETSGETASETETETATCAGPCDEKLAFGLNVPMSIRVANGNLYWSESGADTTQSGIWCMAVAGGLPTHLATVPFAQDLVVDAARVYFARFDSKTVDVYAFPSTGACKPGGSVYTIGPATTFASPLAEDDARVYWYDNASHGILVQSKDADAGAEAGVYYPFPSGYGRSNAMVQNGGTIFWTFESPDDEPHGAVDYLATTGGGSPGAIGNQFFPLGIDVDGTSVYWIDDGDADAGAPQGTVQSKQIAGAGSATIGTAQNNPWGLHVDGTNVYWTNRGTAPDFADGRVVRATLDGKTVQAISGVQTQPTGIAGDADFVYWVDTGPPDPTGTSKTGELHRAAKCCPAVP